jgi:hypothetical protein
MTGASPNTIWPRGCAALDRPTVRQNRRRSSAPRSRGCEIASTPAALPFRNHRAPSLRCRRCALWQRETRGLRSRRRTRRRSTRPWDPRGDPVMGNIGRSWDPIARRSPANAKAGARACLILAKRMHHGTAARSKSRHIGARRKCLRRKRGSIWPL